LVAELKNPSFLAVHPTLDALYAVSEVAGGDRQVVSYRIEDNGSLTETANSESGGNGPCYVSIDKSGKFLFVANYGSGSISVFAIKPDGSLGRVVDQKQHAGSSLNARRQQGAHAHCILPDPSGRYVCAVDLGIDQVVVYGLDHSTGRLSSTGAPLQVTPGNGPRHMAFHPNGKLAFVIHELTSQLSSCSWDQSAGTLSELNTVSTLPQDFSGNNSTAEVLVHPNGRFVFGSNRGHDSIAIFRIEGDGRLTSLGHALTGGKTPRNFRMDPTGQFLLAENQQSDLIVVFRVDAESGRLTQTAHSIQVGSPVCVKFRHPT
jgi:6-phosphogluconolactonase